jgi:hypothetical protein
MRFPRLEKYLEEAEKLRRSYPQQYRRLALVRDFPAWKRSLEPGRTPLDDERPWITFSATRFLEKVLHRRVRVFEYGVGGSTLFFSKRAGEVVSVDDDPAWMDRVRERMDSRPERNWVGHVVRPAPDPGAASADPADPDAYVSGSPAYAGQRFLEYAASIDRFTDESFDLVFIDGRARPSCFKHSLRKVKRRGCILWDNTDREYYRPAMETALEGFAFLDFPGPSPYVKFFTRTSAWRRDR